MRRHKESLVRKEENLEGRDSELVSDVAKRYTLLVFGFLNINM